MKSFNIIKLNTRTPRFRIYAHKMFSVNVEIEMNGVNRREPHL